MLERRRCCVPLLEDPACLPWGGGWGSASSCRRDSPSRAPRDRGSGASKRGAKPAATTFRLHVAACPPRRHRWCFRLQPCRSSGVPVLKKGLFGPTIVELYCSSLLQALTPPPRCRMGHGVCSRRVLNHASAARAQTLVSRSPRKSRCLHVLDASDCVLYLQHVKLFFPRLSSTKPFLRSGVSS